MCETYIFYTIISIFLAVFLVLFAIMIIENNKHKKRMESITRYQINSSAMIDASIPGTLDLIINESFLDYQVKFLLAEELYITEERESEIRKDIVLLVTKRISNNALDKLSMFYNISNIADIMADKIYISVMNYVVEHNTNFKNMEQP